MNCPHCSQPIPDAAVTSAAASISAGRRKRSGPVGMPSKCQKCGEVCPSARALRAHRCPMRKLRSSATTSPPA